VLLNRTFELSPFSICKNQFHTRGIQVNSDNTENTLKIIFEPKWWVLFAIGTGTLMAALDGSVVNTILPVLQTYFQSNVESIQWISTIYLIILSGLLLTFGRLGDIHGHKKLYLWGLVLFVFSSVICGGAWSLPILVIFRGVQAIGGAMLASNAPAILTGNFPSQQRGRAFGMVSTMTYLGLTLGPSLGGWVTQYFSWRMVFYINLPIGIIGFILSLIFIPKELPKTITHPFDIWGAFIFLLGLTTFMIWMNKGAAVGWIIILIDCLRSPFYIYRKTNSLSNARFKSIPNPSFHKFSYQCTFKLYILI
jgi:MFS family permease